MRSLVVKVAAILCAMMVFTAVPAAASEGFVTIGLLPSKTDRHELTIRGTAPAGSVVTILVNGEPQIRMYANDISVYRYPVTLAPGWNMITTQLDGTELSAHAYVFRSN